MIFTMVIRITSFIVIISVYQLHIASSEGRRQNQGALKYPFSYHGGPASGNWLLKPHLRANGKNDGERVKQNLHREILSVSFVFDRSNADTEPVYLSSRTDRIQRNQVTVKKIVEAARKRAHTPASPSHTFVYPSPSPIHTRSATAHMPAPTSMYDSISNVAELSNETWSKSSMNRSTTLTAASSTGLSKMTAIQPKSSSNNETPQESD
ncbi:uncharacterized protein MELLADRAFT_105425 [Melampsora larici-populina 98AG31]|uniref:Uncharacterized protein n=1 Tax=Melampsora larici-populina (strain 98AG31 / pathotype 3-4-7) TaxID=747676 RepID=F4RI34_MELLP|nr:uncharacterized protein MELLADRAFT_105425 [Melampsora larici-populina 98AG31]EGG08027.1 hypothetical protein MELLADRAFT_105425 [Melampsora larici-populina 98AG31]